jgi:hypothetical protein
VETRQIKQRDPVLGCKRRQYRVESVPVGEQRMQQNQVRALARPHCGKRTAAGA